VRFQVHFLVLVLVLDGVSDLPQPAAGPPAGCMLAKFDHSRFSKLEQRIQNVEKRLESRCDALWCSDREVEAHVVELRKVITSFQQALTAEQGKFGNLDELVQCMRKETEMLKGDSTGLLAAEPGKKPAEDAKDDLRLAVNLQEGSIDAGPVNTGSEEHNVSRTSAPSLGRRMLNMLGAAPESDAQAGQSSSQAKDAKHLSLSTCREDPELSGWWISPSVGGDEVWAHHSSRTSLRPPSHGWNIPHDCEIDSTFSIKLRDDATKDLTINASNQSSTGVTLFEFVNFQKEINSWRETVENKMYDLEGSIEYLSKGASMASDSFERQHRWHTTYSKSSRDPMDSGAGVGIP